MPAVDEDFKTAEGWERFVQRHQGLASGEAVLAPGYTERGGVYRDSKGRVVPAEDVQWEWKLRDGSKITLNGRGAVQELTEAKPSVQTGTIPVGQTVDDPRHPGTPIAVATTGGVVNLPKETPWQDSAKWIDQPDGGKRWQAFNPATGLMQDVGGVAPVPATDKSKPAPEMKQVNGVWMQRPAGSTDPNAWTNAGLPTEVDKAAGATPTFKEFEGKTYQWVPDATKAGGGSFKLAEGMAEGAHAPGYFIEGGYRVHKSWNEGTKKYEVDSDPQYPPEAWSPEAKASEAKLAAAPTEGKERPNIVGGFHVTQKYSGGEWTTTDIGARATPEEVRQLTAGTDTPYIVQSGGAQGGLTTSDNPNYQGPKAPTTRGELAQRVALLQSQAMQMKDKIQADQSIKPDQQAARFAAWYDQNIMPQAGALEQQQQAIIQDENLKAIEQQRTNLASASSAMQGLMPYRVGPGYGQAFESLVSDTANTKFAGAPNQPAWKPPAGWSTFKAPNLDEHIKNLVGAQTAPAPGMDLQSALNRDQWMPGGAPPQAGGGAPAPAMAGQVPQHPVYPGLAQGTGPAGQVPQHPVYPGLAQGTGPVPPGQSSYTIPGLNPSMMPGGQGLADFRAALPPPAVMPLASGSGPLPYAQFNGVLPALPNFDYSQVQNPYQWPFGAGGGGNSGFTAGP